MSTMTPSTPTLLSSAFAATVIAIVMMQHATPAAKASQPRAGRT